MNTGDILSGKAGLTGIQWALNGQSSRHLLRRTSEGMLRQGYHAGAFHLTRAKYKPDRRLQAYYTFPALDVEGAAVQTILLAAAWEANPDGAEQASLRSRILAEAGQAGLLTGQSELWKSLPDRGITLQLWPLDPEFPQLVRLGDPAFTARLFSTLGIVHEPKRTPVITPIRYRPGERHVLRYDIYPPGVPDDNRMRLYAKLYTDPEDAARAFRVASRVVDWLAAETRGFQGNRPAALSQADGVIFYPHAPGIPLSHQLARSHRWLGEQLQATGRALAVLHRGPETLQTELKQNSFTNEVKVVKRASEHIQVLLPETYQKILTILDMAQEQYAALPQEAPTFTHSDFKADHLLSTPQGLTLIDFDTCTLTDPALDIGKFLADLEWWFSLKGISGVEEAHQQLLKGYLGDAQPGLTMQARIARARLFHALILVKIIVRRAPLFDKDWVAITTRMVARAAQTLHNPLAF